MVPLEKRKINLQENGKSVEHPALSPKWVEQRCFPLYLPPPPLSEGIDMRDWYEMMNFLRDDLHWLLKLPHHKFWSQVVFDKSVHTSLVSFLQNAPRFYAEEETDDPKGKMLVEEIQKLTFLTFLRMSTHKESKDCFLTPSAFGELIYENFIFDIPKMMDMAILYGPANSNLLSKMFGNIFSNQPSYKFDLDESAKSLVQVFHLLLGRLGLDESQAAGSSSGCISDEELSEVIIYMLDIAATLWYFLEVHPAASSAFITANIPLEFAELYEKAVPYLSRLVELSKSTEKTKMSHNLKLARKFMLRTSNALLHSSTIKLLFTESQGSDSHEKYVEIWLEWFTSLVSERLRHFLVDYNLMFPIQDDIDLMSQMGAPIDPTRLEYVKGALKGFVLEFGLSTTPSSVRSADGGLDFSKMISLISQVKELLPDLGDHFVEACLKHYDFNPESVVNAVLEGNLAPHLMAMDASVIPPPIPEVKPQDELVDISKKSRTKTVHFSEMREMLDDKKKDLKNVILERVNEQLADEYEDEYDDTYDSQAVGSEEPDAHGEGDLVRPFVVPRVLQSNVEVEEEDDEDDGSAEQPAHRPRDQFVANPAELRELAEQRRLNRRGYRRPGPTPAQRDVVGAPRGQGQDKDTIIARRQKNENKTRGANHNRRAMADRKRREF